MEEINMIHNITTKIGMAVTFQSDATGMDWLYGIISLSPLLPCFIFIPKLVRKHTMRFDWRWFKLYSRKRHNRRLTEMYGIEFVV